MSVRNGVLLQKLLFAYLVELPALYTNRCFLKTFTRSRCLHLSNLKIRMLLRKV